MRKGRSFLLLMLIFVLLIGAAVVSFLFFEFGRPPAVPPAAYLEIPLQGPLVEFPETHWLATLFQGESLSLHDVWMGLRKARVDPRITGVLLRLGILECDWAKCSEIRDAVLEFRKSGKKAVAFFEEAPLATKEYSIAAACDRIIVHPLGWMGVAGIGGQVPFFKNGLDRLGISVEVEHVEEYKTAYSQFTESGFTPAHKEMIESLLRDRFDRFCREAAAARGKTEAEFRTLVDRGFFQAEEAVRAGLADDLLYQDQVEDLFRSGGRKSAPVRLADYARVPAASLGLQSGRRVALLYASGPIHSGESLSQTMGSETIGRWLRAAREDRSIAAVVLRVDSPGGSAVAADAIWREITLTRKAKPVVVSMSDMAGSGGYWIATAASRIVAQPQTLTASIGVLSVKIDASRLLAKLGISAETVRFGRHADFFSPLRPWSEEERRLMKTQILWIYDRFLAKTAEARGLTKEAVDAIGKGRVWSGAQALERKLVDELGGLDQAIAAAKALAGIDPREDVNLVVWPRKVSFWRSLLGRREAAAAPVAARLGGAAVVQALRFVEILGRDRIWALVPDVLGF